MKRKLLSLALGIPALAIGIGAASAGADDDLAGAIAVVDFDAVHNALPRAAELEAEIKELATELDAGLAEMNRSIEEKRIGVEDWAEGSDERARAMIAFEMAKFEYERQVDFSNFRMGKARKEALREVVVAVQQGIARFAKQKGFKLVLRKRRSDYLNASEDVVYADDAFDITTQVIQFLKAAPAPKPNGK